MSDSMFEYFLDPSELEPFYSELARVDRRAVRKRKSGSPRQTCFRGAAPLVSPANMDTDDEATRDTVCRNKPVENRQFLPYESAEIQASDSDANAHGASVAMEKHRLAAEPEFDQPSNLSANSECDRQRPNPESDPGPKVFEDRKRTGHRTRVRRLISVHALGQSAFCARAGILALEQGDDRDPLEPLPRLSYLPCFDREQIEEVLKQKIGNVGLAVLYGISMACLAAKGHFEQQRTFFLASFLMLIACLCWLVSLCIAISRLVSRRRAAIEAEARVPEPTVAGVQPVNWWSMLKAGFEPVAYQRPFRHPELALEGCPWRVLERDSLRIPVIRAGSRKLGDKPGELYAKHHLRLVAYSMLLEATDHFEVPYALVFPCDSPDGYAVPITDELRTWALQILTRFDEQVHASQQRQQEPPTPRQRSRCASCSYGFPVPITDREIKKFRKTGGSLLVLKSSNGKTFHCLCGDRFGSPPPHAKSIELELTTSLR